MKAKIIAITLFTVTISTIAILPLHESNGTVSTLSPSAKVAAKSGANIEMVFVLDTTGSMGGLIQAAKEKIWSIASSMASAQQSPVIKMGLVAYRDRGDAYVTRVVDLSTDLDSMYATLMDFKAAGGGDGPESVNQALYDAINAISWSQDPHSYKVVFLLGDAPPHMDYLNDIKYPVTLRTAQHKGIIVNAIQAGNLHRTTGQWQQIAQLGQGRYFRVEQSGNAVAIATPYDKSLAELSTKLDATRLYYGTRVEKARQGKKITATKKLNSHASLASRARRATFNVSKSGEANFLGKGDLIDDLKSGRVDLPSLPAAQLPESLQAIAPEKREAAITRQGKRRSELKQQISKQARLRADFLRQKVKALGGVKDSLDEKIYGAIREQAAVKGLVYDAKAPNY